MDEGVNQCPICLQEANEPVRLPCSHVFCFLCAKGAILHTGLCPMCRTSVPNDFLNNPELIENSQLNIAVFEDQYRWYYEGRNGWWLYDARASQEIEKEFQNKHPNCEVLIAGFMYVIDFESMTQYRKEGPLRTRKIKRDVFDSNTKGVAGLRVQVNH